MSSKKTMRAIQVDKFGGSEVLKLKSDLAVPQLLAPTQVLVRVLSACINPLDTYIRAGQISRLPNLPYVPGDDAAGYVEAMGSEVKRGRLSLGMRVFVTGWFTGAYAEYVVKDQDYVFPLHERLSFAQGAALGGSYFTAYLALVLSADAKPGESVLVHGASGGCGTATVQFARAMGLTVVGTAGTKDGMSLVSKCGAHHVFNHRQEDYEKKMLEQIGEPGFDVIIEHVANINLDRDLKMVNEGGRIIVVGSRGPANINPAYLMLQECSIKGVYLRHLSHYKEAGAAIVGGIEAGWIDPLIDREYALEDAQQSHDDIINSKGAKGNLVLKIGKD